MIVLKFGGTSVGGGAAIQRVARIVNDRGAGGAVVVASAMAGVTDELVKAAAFASRGDRDAAFDVEEVLRGRHERALSEAVPVAPVREEAAGEVDRHLSTLRSALDRAAVPGADPRRAADAILGHGELLSTTILSAALRSVGREAVWIDAREVVITDDCFGKAVPDTSELTRRARNRMCPRVAAGVVPVTQGFIGATPDGTPTTLGRGGSDFTGALLGSALEADEVQIWTDVPGLMTADPRLVAHVRPLSDATFDEAAELSYFGAKVLHPATLIPVIDADIPVRILNSMDPDAPGTLISSVADGRPGEVKSIASKRGVTTLSLQAPRMLGTHGFLRRMFEIFDRFAVSVDVVSTSEVSISISIEDGAVTDALMKELEILGRVVVRPDRAIICVVGEGLRETPGVAARIFKAVAPVNVEMISQGGSGINVTLVVNGVDSTEAVRRLHQEFFPPAG